MKKIIIGIIITISLLIVFLSIKNTENENIIYNQSGLQVSQSQDKSISILKLDLSKVNIDFGGLESDNKFETPDSISDRFNRLAAIEIPRIAGENKLLAGINGQFFNAKKNPTVLSFPIKSQNQIITSYVDNQLQKRTFVINKNGIPKILEGYNADMISNPLYQDLIVGIHPDENFMKNSSLSRNFMGILNDSTLVFILATSKTQAEMTELMIHQGVSKNNIIMFDGGPSVQFSLIDYLPEKPTIQSYYGGWAVPHFFIISER